MPHFALALHDSRVQILPVRISVLLFAREALPRSLAGHAHRGPDLGPGDAAGTGFAHQESQLALGLSAGGGNLGQQCQQVVVAESKLMLALRYDWLRASSSQCLAYSSPSSAR